MVLVVPCFNEQKRWDVNYWKSLREIEDIQLLFVDDGSTDLTWDLLCEQEDLPDVTLLRLPENVGKAEAVRQGLLHASFEFPYGVGFIDADGAFPTTEVIRIVNEFRVRSIDSQQFDAVWTARVKLSGRDIQRRAMRHYIARILLTVLAILNPFVVYDSQSGFKIFRWDRYLEVVLEQPFKTRWFIDLEIYFRWQNHLGRPPGIWEEPVSGWRDVEGSKLRGTQLIQVLRDVLFISRRRNFQKLSNQ